jgi:hypothetical protein
MSHKQPQSREAPPVTVPEKTPPESVPKKMKIKLPERRKDYQLGPLVRPDTTARPDTAKDSTANDSTSPPRE